MSESATSILVVRGPETPKRRLARATARRG
jgi:hypothetical protein